MAAVPLPGLKKLMCPSEALLCFLLPVWGTHAWGWRTRRGSGQNKSWAPGAVSLRKKNENILPSSSSHTLNPHNRLGKSYICGILWNPTSVWIDNEWSQNCYQSNLNNSGHWRQLHTVLGPDENLNWHHSSNSRSRDLSTGIGGPPVGGRDCLWFTVGATTLTEEALRKYSCYYSFLVYFISGRCCLFYLFFNIHFYFALFTFCGFLGFLSCICALFVCLFVFFFIISMYLFLFFPVCELSVCLFFFFHFFGFYYFSLINCSHIWILLFVLFLFSVCFLVPLSFILFIIILGCCVSVFLILWVHVCVLSPGCCCVFVFDFAVFLGVSSLFFSGHGARLVGSWFTGQASGLGLQDQNVKFRMLDHQRIPGPR